MTFLLVSEGVKAKGERLWRAGFKIPPFRSDRHAAWHTLGIFEAYLRSGKFESWYV